ncbi:MAG: RluA family pseudouridine synthase [Deltaproteobacteria bacterium]|nr:RluA family pseudouridine synthase [Deltaproteobacteria bacterium]
MSDAPDSEHEHEHEEHDDVALEVPFPDRGQRLDAWLTQHLEGQSRSRLAQLIEQEHVLVDDVAVGKPSFKLRGGERVVVHQPAPVPSTLVGQDLPLVFVYDDDDLCVIDKPAGLVVHPGPGHPDGTVANALVFRFPALSIGGERRPGIVHRLDKDTSGLLVVAKHDQSMRSLARLFHDREIDKRYIALCLGTPTATPTSTEAAFDLVTGHQRSAADRRRFTTKVAPPENEGGPNRRAHTRFVVRETRDSVALVDVELMTGRSHQIRAHLADLGHPILQDELYGGAHAEKRIRNGAVHDAVVRLKRQALHAVSLKFDHPRTGEKLRFESPLPADLKAVVDAVLAG